MQSEQQGLQKCGSASRAPWLLGMLLFASVSCSLSFSPLLFFAGDLSTAQSASAAPLEEKRFYSARVIIQRGSGRHLTDKNC